MSTLESYNLAVRTGARPRHVLHIERNGDGLALCGVGAVVFLADVEHVDLDSAIRWPLCSRCRALRPDIDFEAPA